MPEGYIPTLQFQPYVSPYTAAPVKEFNDFGELLNKRYDDSIAKHDKLDELMNQIQVSDADQHLKQGLLSDTRGIIKEIVKNGDWENADSPMREVARRFANDSIISTAVNNFQKSQKLEDESRQAEMNGKPQIKFKDYTNFSTVDPDTGQVRHLDPNGAYEDRLDYQKKMQDTFDGLHANATGNKTNNMIRDPDTGQLYQAGSGSQWQGVTKTDVVNAANRNFGSYLASSEGQQRLKVLTSKNSDNPNPIDTGSAINLMKQELINTGMNRVFSESSKESFTKPDRYNKGLASTTPSGTLINDVAYNQNQGLDSLIDVLDKKDRTTYNKKSSPFSGDIGGLNSDTFKHYTGYGAVPDNQKDLYNNLRSVFTSGVDTKGKTKEQIDDLVNPKIKKYLQNIKDSKIQPNLLAYNDPKDISTANDFFRNGMYQSAEYLDPQTGQKLSWDEIQKNYQNTSTGKGLSDTGPENDIDKAKVTGFYSPDNPFYDMTGKDPNFANAKKVSIGGHQFVVAATAQDKQDPSFRDRHLIAEISSARRTGLPIKLSNGVSVYSNGDNGGFLLKQGDGELRGKKDGTPLSLEETYEFLAKNGILPETK